MIISHFNIRCHQTTKALLDLQNERLVGLSEVNGYIAFRMGIHAKNPSRFYLVNELNFMLKHQYI